MYRSVKRIVTFCLLGLAALAQAETNPAVPADTTAVAKSNPQVIVYYLYFTPRCETCINMEIYAQEAVEQGFARELQEGRVQWHSYDVGLSEYEHFWDDYKLETKALIMVELRDGQPVRWKNCEKIWDLVSVHPVYLEYVQDEVRAYLSH